MTTLITGGNGSLANHLKKYIDGDYYGKDMLDITDRNIIKNLPEYDFLIHTAAGGKDLNNHLDLLFSKAKKIFVFTSKQGTFFNWKKAEPIAYGLEKVLLNFIVYRHNMKIHNAQLIEPGHMYSGTDYDHIAKKFSAIYIDWKFDKNLIYDLPNNRYINY